MMNDYDRHFLHPRETPVTTFQSNWWTTTGGSTFIPPGTEPSKPSSSSRSTGSDQSSGANTLSTGQTGNGGAGGLSTTTFTTAFPVSTFTQSSSVITLFSQSVVTSVSTLPPTSTNSGASQSSVQSSGTAFPDTNPTSTHAPVCIGGGLDAQSDGLLTSLIIPSAIGLLIWVRARSFLVVMNVNLLNIPFQSVLRALHIHSSCLPFCDRVLGKFMLSGNGSFRKSTSTQRVVLRPPLIILLLW